VSTLAGAIFGKREPRIVEIDGIAIEAIPVGHVLVFWNWDRPGLIGGIGTTLGKHGINIGQFQFGREAAGARAVTLLNVDGDVDDAVLAELRTLPNVISVTKAYL
jgi:D-3-phosphoglycerate dehydrogenase